MGFITLNLVEGGTITVSVDDIQAFMQKEPGRTHLVFKSRGFVDVIDSSDAINRMIKGE